jgi:predicted DCC family thiol-disulfide oxidoreductase YuxK
VTIVPSQAPGTPEAFGLTQEDCRRWAWAVDEQGRAWSGAGAVAAALDAGLDTGIFRVLYGLPLLGPIGDLAYRVVARIRHRLPGTIPYCQRHPERCAGEAE